MLCPIDQTELVMTDRQGVEIDYCPTCRGVWLDRGELDKIIERSENFSGSASGAASPDDDKRYVGRTPEVGGMRGNIQRMADRARRDDDDDDRYDDRYDDKGRPRKKKRGSFLGELFDFD